MRQFLRAVVIVALAILCTGVSSLAEGDASAANNRQKVQVADSSKALAGFAGWDSISSVNKDDLFSIANRHQPQTRNDPRRGQHSAVDTRILERA